MTESEQNMNKRGTDNMAESIENEKTAEYLLKDSQLQPVDAARLIMELLEASPGKDQLSINELMCHCREVINMGLKAKESMTHTVKFIDAVKSLEFYKNSVRERTMSEIRQICRRILRSSPEWRKITMREVDTEFCQRTIESIFPTVPMQRKAKRILHSVFTHAIMCGWCSTNPLDLVVLAPYVEKPIRALMLDEVKSLLETAMKPRYKPCAAAVGIMLWAGIRPSEVQRLKWSDIDFEERVITVPANHSKTGGARHVTIYAPLYYWLRKCKPIYLPSSSIVPASWLTRWNELRRAAGFVEWVPDVLRHTFASYHLKHFRDINALLMDMGHASPQQLRTRYLSMQNVTKKSAKAFWEYGVPSSTK